MEETPSAIGQANGFGHIAFRAPSSETCASRICEGTSGVLRIVISRAIAGQ